MFMRFKALCYTLHNGAYTSSLLAPPKPSFDPKRQLRGRLQEYLQTELFLVCKIVVVICLLCNCHATLHKDLDDDKPRSFSLNALTVVTCKSLRSRLLNFLPF